MAKFPHLPLKSILDGSYKFKGFPGAAKSYRTLQNLKNREAHGSLLQSMVDNVQSFNQDIIVWRREQGLPDLPNESIVPILIKVDPNGFNIEGLKGFGVEIIAEEGAGFILGASVDQFTSLRDKIEKFKNSENQGTAQIWEIIQGNQWRPEYILSEDLCIKWHSGIVDAEIIIVDISIACYIKKSVQPSKKAGGNDKSFKKSLARWYDGSLLIDAERERLMMERQDQVQTFIELGGGSILGSFVEFPDSFGFRAELSGLALKDIILNYQYVFEIAEHIEVDNNVLIHEDYGELDINIVAPEIGSPKICVIDSGIQEHHLLIAPAMLLDRSINFVPNETTTTTTDTVPNGGHGTKVAGAILYGGIIPRTGNFQAPFFLANARVLNADKAMSSSLFQPALMCEIADHYSDINIFNLSINAWGPCRIKHMSQWASALDSISHHQEKIFVVSAGNLEGESLRVNSPGIKNHLSAGRTYPSYLLEKSSRIADPAQSLFAITVGSACIDEFSDPDRISFGKKDYPSSFSRSGLGMWGAIKPELVEYGGDWIKERAGNNLTLHSSTTPELVKTGMYGVGNVDIGISFCAPKVAHILASLEKLFPKESVLFHKALLIQSARLPEIIWAKPEIRHLQYFGYGIPNLDRAIDNTPHRITFTEVGKIAPKKAKIFSVKIPEELRKQGEAYDILIEVSLCFTAEPRRTRKYLKSYLSAWITWESSKLGQSSTAFQNDVLKELEDVEQDDEIEEPEDPSSIRWAIWSNSKWGKIKDVKRQGSANQKDWTILKSYQLPSELSFAVIGHKGWEDNLQKEVPYAFVVTFEIIKAEIEIYEIMQKVNMEIPITAQQQQQQQVEVR
ncbi:S8 family peptidase [Pedobacter gandavensis]|uniref:S8 family peptidase n=1 Tax=Pedobacter gandavensis TaxID=2679963 RepID=UPI00292CC1A7|nr:S8 family peptidase [Pedobacter gandavensis]